MTTLGGHIFVYRGLLKKLRSENAIAMLLAHEMAHVKYRHALKGLGKGIALSTALSLMLGQTADVSANLVTRTGALTLLKFSRDQEQASDELALESMQKVYHHVAGVKDLFLSLQGENNTAVEFLSSHPDTLKRIKYLQSLAKKHAWMEQGELIIVPEHIRKMLLKPEKSQKNS